MMVRTFVVLSLCATLFVARNGLAPAQGKGDDDNKLFQGKWREWRSVQAPRTTADSGEGMVIEGKAVQFLYNGDNKGGTATLTLRPDANPKEIDLEHTFGRWKGKKQLGIYQFTADGQLEISWAEPGSEKRPTKFSGGVVPGSGNPFVIYRSTQFKLPEAVAKELKALHGKWNLVEYHRFGRAEPKAKDRREGMVIDEDDIQYLWGGLNKGGKARFVVDPTKDPPHIEVVYTVGQERYHKRIGIYKLKGDRLEISLSEYESEKRPTAFSGIKGAAGAGEAYFVYEREK